MDVPHAVLGQGLVHAVEERPQEPPQHPHQDEEGKVQGAPQVAALVSVWTLSSRDTFRPSAPPAEGLWGGVTLNSPKLSSPGSWKDPQRLKLIPDRKKLSVKAADMEQKSCRDQNQNHHGPEPSQPRTVTEPLQPRTITAQNHDRVSLRPPSFLGVLGCQRTTFQVRAWFQKEEPSSRLKRVPPIGAPKAAATPAAAPADTKSLFSLKGGAAELVEV